MAERTPAERDMADLLDSVRFPFEEQLPFAGHKIDFTVYLNDRAVLLDVNGDRWHRWQKIVDCDRKKLNRMLEAGGIPLAAWWSRVKKEPDAVLAAIVLASHGRLAYWDWAVDLDSLSPVASERAKAALGEGWKR